MPKGKKDGKYKGRQVRPGSSGSRQGNLARKLGVCLGNPQESEPPSSPAAAPPPGPADARFVEMLQREIVKNPGAWERKLDQHRNTHLYISESRVATCFSRMHDMILRTHAAKLPTQFFDKKVFINTGYKLFFDIGHVLAAICFYVGILWMVCWLSPLWDIFIWTLALFAASGVSYVIKFCPQWVQENSRRVPPVLVAAYYVTRAGAYDPGGGVVVTYKDTNE